MTEIPSKTFVALCKEIARTGKPKKMTVRQLLGEFGQERRGHAVVRTVRSKLRRLGVETNPPFDQEHLDGEISLVRRVGAKPSASTKITTKVATSEPAKAVVSAKASSVSNPTSESAVEESQEEEERPYLTVALLAAASRKPYSVHRDAELKKATTLMQMHKTNYVLVMPNERSVDGVVSWESIGRHSFGNKTIEKAGDCMDPNFHVLKKDASLFDAVRHVIHHGLVLVQSHDKIIYGPITTSDIAEQYIKLTEPFLLLEQIENHLRNLLKRAHLSQDQLRTLIDPADVRRKESAKTVDDLTFGEYLRGLSNPEVWVKLKLNVDRVLFIERLDAIRRIRNNVMHFHPDGISESEHDILSKTREMLQSF